MKKLLYKMDYANALRIFPWIRMDIANNVLLTNAFIAKPEKVKNVNCALAGILEKMKNATRKKIAIQDVFIV